ncbi:hypothetical protein OHA38_43555 (plasmid) [Streptomyces sp. NBC_01732]|uniref:hypothetical protein n=1 Tax=Streptomyces sp. NBC_01732 TaxID=2975926 RepID=UPI00352E47E7|nr:hypothetical protein OHA38_43555 [Streptomyces sp. NBC_01732]
MKTQDARAYREALARRHRSTHADTVRTQTGRIYWYDALNDDDGGFCTAVADFEAPLPVCDETGCDCSRAAARWLVADKPRAWHSRRGVRGLREGHTHVNVIFEGPNGPRAATQTN